MKVKKYQNPNGPIINPLAHLDKAKQGAEVRARLLGFQPDENGNYDLEVSEKQWYNPGTHVIRKDNGEIVAMRTEQPIQYDPVPAAAAAAAIAGPATAKVLPYVFQPGNIVKDAGSEALGSVINGVANAAYLTQGAANAAVDLKYDKPWYKTALDASMVIGGVTGMAKELPTLKTIARNILKIPKLEMWYTGVPDSKTYNFEKFDDPDKFIWMSDSKDYARSYSTQGQSDGKIFRVYTDPDDLKILNTPDPVEGAYAGWKHLPFKINKSSNGVSVQYADGVTKSTTVRPMTLNRRGTGKMENKVLLVERDPNVHGEFKIGDYKTDDLVKIAHDNGYNGIKFNGIVDGTFTRPDGSQYWDTINEYVISADSPRFSLNENDSILKLILSDKYLLHKNGGKIHIKPNSNQNWSICRDF